MIQFIPALKDTGIAVETHRVFADGDLVVTHSTYDNAQAFGAPTLVGIDVFRIENGKLAEHWDNLQPPAPPNASGRTMTDGPTEVTDLDQTEANKALVAEFAQAVLIEGDFSRIADFVIGGDAYMQHNSLSVMASPHSAPRSRSWRRRATGFGTRRSTRSSVRATSS